MVFNPKSSKIAPSTALEPTTFLHYLATAQSIPGQRGVMFGVRGHNVWLDNKDSRCNAGSLRVTTQKLHLDKTFQLSRGEKKKTLLKILGFLFSSHFSSAIKRLSKTCFFVTSVSTQVLDKSFEDLHGHTQVSVTVLTHKNTILLHEIS